MPKVGKPQKHGKRWRFSYYDASGKRRWESHATKREAVLAQAERRLEIQAVREGRGAVDRTKTFEELEAHWKVVKSEKRSLKDDIGRLNNHLRPAFGGLRLDAITGVRVAHYRKALMDRVSAEEIKVGTVRQILALLRAMLREAERMEWIVRAPPVRLPRREPVDPRWIQTEEDLAKFLRAAQQVEHPVALPFYAAAIYTGLRLGELAGLRWSDISLEQRTIRVRRSYDRPTKGWKNRTVPILDPLLPVLRAWQDETPYPEELVFPSLAGTMLKPDCRLADQVLKLCFHLSELEYVNFHGLRHTFASHWVRRGGDIFRLQRILGHASVQTTQETYAHLAPDAFRQDWDRLEDVVPVLDTDAGAEERG